MCRCCKPLCRDCCFGDKDTPFTCWNCCFLWLGCGCLGCCNGGCCRKEFRTGAYYTKKKVKSLEQSVAELQAQAANPAAVPPQATMNTGTTSTFCGQCGVAMQKGNKFCNSCGAPQ